jgi:NCS2 family nucleobase:cation symporter-2
MIYVLDDKPPLHIVLLNGVQHVGLISINLVYPLLICRLLGIAPEQITNVLAISMLVLGVGTFLQSLRLGPVGSGYMLPSTFTATFFGASILAAKAGGLPLVFGMTAFAGGLEMALAPLLNRMRAIFPPEISGLVIFMIGISAGLAGLRTSFGPQVAPLSHDEWLVAALTLASMIALNIWGGGIARMLCSLIGLAAGYLAAGAFGLFGAKELASVEHASWIGFPSLNGISYSFDTALAVPFLIGSIAVAMKAIGTITVCQRMNDANWVRPDMKSAMRGVMADGIANVLAGLAGTVGTNTSTPSAGLAAATGVAARTVALAAGAIFLLLGFLPKLPALLAVMPRAVILPALLFSVAFIMINGLEMMTSRLIDSRRTLVLGLSMMAGVAVEVFPSIAASVPKPLTPIIGSSLVFATVVALALNLVFRLGVRKTITVRLEPRAWNLEEVEDMLRKQGAIWGARADVINRAAWAVSQVVEAVAENCWYEGQLMIQVSFDEFNLDVRMSYTGELLEFPQRRPSDEEILNTDDGVRRLAGYMLRNISDRARSGAKEGKSQLVFHFDH